MTDTNPFGLPGAHIRLTEQDDDGSTTATTRGRTHHGALETFQEIAGTFTVRPEDPDARIRRETWLITHGMDPSYAGNASWVDDLIAKEDNDNA